jgi:tripartite-type tricarboxylate transporter receptor subunit TctC
MLRTVLASTMAFAALSSAQAQSSDAFYAGKNLEIYAGSSAGAGYDLYARLLSRHIGKHLPGTPTIVVKNLAGAGGLRLANWLYSVAPRDGSVIGTFGRGVAFESLLNPKSDSFDGRKFGWIGSVNDEVSVCVAWNSSGVDKFEDVFAKELTVGSTGAGGDTFIFSTLLNGVLGAKLKIVSGYPGGNEISLAMERGEVQGRCGWSWSSLSATHAKWVEGGQVRVLAQLGLAKHPDLPNVPLALEFAKSDEQRDSLRLVFARQAMAWPFAAPPGTPAARVQDLRKAFMAALQDPALLADAGKGGFEVRPVSGEDIDTMLGQAFQIPEAVVKRTAGMLK